MRPAMITAVLLLVGIINTVTALSEWEVDEVCFEHYDGSCVDNDDYWILNQLGRCRKYFQTPKTFQEAQDHCLSVDSELVSIHDADEMFDVMCLSFQSTFGFNDNPFWIGAQRSGDGFKYTDGTEFNYTNWLRNQPNNVGGEEGCIEANFLEWGKWNDARCSEKKGFMCMKKK